MCFDELRSCYTYPARLYPGGPVVQLRWYWCDDDAADYEDWHRFFAWSQYLQDDNDVDDPEHVGEVTPSGYRAGGPFFNLPNAKRPKYYRPYDKGAPPAGLLGAGEQAHGTPASYMCEPEPDGHYYVKIYDPDTITLEEWNSLPECVRDKWGGVWPIGCENELLIGEDEILGIGGGVDLILGPCCTCDNELLIGDDEILGIGGGVDLILGPCECCDSELLIGEDEILGVGGDVDLILVPCDE